MNSNYIYNIFRNLNLEPTMSRLEFVNNSDLSFLRWIRRKSEVDMIRNYLKSIYCLVNLEDIDNNKY